MDEQQIKSSVDAALGKLHSTHLTMSVATMVLALFALLGGGYFVHRSMQSYEVQLARADQQNQQFQAAYKSLQDQLVQSAQQRAANDKQVQVIERTQVIHDRQAEAEIAKVTAPDATAEQVVRDSTAYLKITPAVTTDGLFSFTKTETQGLIATSIDRDNLKLAVESKDKELGLQRQNTDLTLADLKSCQNTLGESQKTVTAYKAAAKKSKFKRFLDGAAKVGIFVAGAYLGHVL